jgi:hypothetical protein
VCAFQGLVQPHVYLLICSPAARSHSKPAAMENEHVPLFDREHMGCWLAGQRLTQCGRERVEVTAVVRLGQASGTGNRQQQQQCTCCTSGHVW